MRDLVLMSRWDCLYSVVEATNHDETSSDDTDNIDKVDKIESSKILKSIDHK